MDHIVPAWQMNVWMWIETDLAGDVQDIHGAHHVGQADKLGVDIVLLLGAAAHFAHRLQRPRAALGDPRMLHYCRQRDALPRVLRAQHVSISWALDLCYQLYIVGSLTIMLKSRRIQHHFLQWLRLTVAS